jgi:hypothetical protein
MKTCGLSDGENWMFSQRSVCISEPHKDQTAGVSPRSFIPALHSGLANLFCLTKKAREGWGCISVVELLLSMGESLSPTIQRERERERERENAQWMEDGFQEQQ